MRDLAGIAEINGPNRAALAAERAATVRRASIEHPFPATYSAGHGERVKARAIVNNSPFASVPAHLGMDGIHSAIDQKPNSPFMIFWNELNEQRGTEVRYGEARALFKGGETPSGAVTFVENGDGLRAVTAPDHDNGEEAWYGEYREVTGKGTKWHRVVNDAGNPISYSSPTYALHGARWTRDQKIEKAFR